MQLLVGIYKRGMSCDRQLEYDGPPQRQMSILLTILTDARTGCLSLHCDSAFDEPIISNFNTQGSYESWRIQTDSALVSLAK